MCGIVGIFRTQASSTPISSDVLNCMRDTMSHRGPDAASSYISPQQEIGLGHRRLSIIDLTEVACQPMANEDDSVIIVFNGEIYNHAEIRPQLEQLGRKFKTSHSDTEVILRGYEQWGEQILDRLRGMFAFVIWDKKAGKLWMVRDRMGVKPLYYSSVDGMFLFASEIKALLEFPGTRRALNARAFYDYLTFVVTPAPDTLFDNIHKLPAGHTMTVYKNGQTETKRYWNPFTGVSAIENRPEEEWVERIMATLKESVRYRMVSDVKFGAFLSGGIDSSANVALMDEQMDRPVETFSLGFADEHEMNELKFARKIVERYKTNHHEFILGPNEFVNFLPQLILHQDEPIADPVCVPIYFLSKLARDNNTPVCLVGEGSDELFFGYPHWGKMLKLAPWLKAYGHLPNAFHRALTGLFSHSSMIPWNFMRRVEVLRRVSSGEQVFWGGGEAYQETTKHRIISQGFRKQLQGYTSVDAVKSLHDDFLRDAPEGADELHWMAYIDLRFRLPELVLMRVDKMSMAASIEGREPFLDQELIRLAMSIPGSLKYKNQTLKHLLKRAVEPILPSEIIHRPKQGFAVPLDDWFEARLRTWVDEKIARFVQTHEYFDKTVANDFLRKSGGMKNWYLLNFALWHEKWIEQRNIELPV